jgi:hypothetical protein
MIPTFSPGMPFASIGAGCSPVAEQMVCRMEHPSHRKHPRALQSLLNLNPPSHPPKARRGAATLTRHDALSFGLACHLRGSGGWNVDSRSEIPPPFRMHPPGGVNRQAGVGKSVGAPHMATFNFSPFSH